MFLATAHCAYSSSVLGMWSVSPPTGLLLHLNMDISVWLRFFLNRREKYPLTEISVFQYFAFFLGSLEVFGPLWTDVWFWPPPVSAPQKPRALLYHFKSKHNFNVVSASGSFIPLTSGAQSWQYCWWSDLLYMYLTDFILRIHTAKKYYI